uniref:Uncharacterized protein n=1 Tax=viral metagenome TaxID=1070528 RepID=A0A6C0H2I1_9ZZZZ
METWAILLISGAVLLAVAVAIALVAIFQPWKPSATGTSASSDTGSGSGSGSGSGTNKSKNKRSGSNKNSDTDTDTDTDTESGTHSGTDSGTHTYTSQNNTTNKGGCIYNPGLTSSHADESLVQKTCDAVPSCVGYYSNDVGTSFLATPTLPKDCKDTTGPVGYIKFKSKSSKYTSKENKSNGGSAGCIYTPGITTSDQNAKVVQATCDADPKCVGYYSNDDQSGWTLATRTLPSSCSDFSSPPGYTKFYKKVEHKKK